MSTDWFLKKSKFNRYAEAVVLFNEIARKEPPTLSQQRALGVEEFTETYKAWEERDKVEYLDGLIDSFVVSSYFHYMQSGSTDVEQFKGDPTVYMGEVLDNVKYNFDMWKLLHVSMLLLQSIDVDYEGAIQEVLYSNMSKFTLYHSSDEGAYDRERDWIMENTEYVGVTWEVNKDYVVFKDENNKVMKPSYYVAPVLEPYIN
jgi:hypothetical protein